MGFLYCILQAASRYHDDLLCTNCAPFLRDRDQEAKTATLIAFARELKVPAAAPQAAASSGADGAGPTLADLKALRADVMDSAKLLKDDPAMAGAYAKQVKKIQKLDDMIWKMMGIDSDVEEVE